MRRRVAAIASTMGLLGGGWATAASAGAATTDPGITSNSVTVASVAVLSGPVPGLFQGAPYGASAYFDYINSKGGVNGRKLILKSLDDGLSCANNTSAFSTSINSVFAYVGSMSVLDNCGATVLKAHPDVPSVAWELSTAARALPNGFDPEPQPTGYRLGGFKWYKQHYPKDMKVGGIYNSTPGAVINWNAQKAAMESLGYKFVYSRPFQPTETSFTSDIVRMRSDGVNFVWVTDDDIGTISRLINDANQQNWHPLFVSGDTAYDPNLPKLLNGNAGNGMLTDQLTAMFQGEDSKRVPAVKLFRTWMQKAHPGFTPDLYSVWGWADAELFVQALKEAGKNPTRASVLKALRSIHKFSADGLMAPDDPGRQKPSNCYLVIKYENKKWSRVTPKNGFQCNPGGYYYYHGS